MPYNQGDIVIVGFPFTDISQGTKQRPAIVVSNTDVNATPDVILAAITTELRADEFSFQINNAHLSTPLRRPSEARVHKLFTCDQSAIDRKISSMRPQSLDLLLKEVRRCFTTT
jgi:mRNA interferase MazF